MRDFNGYLHKEAFCLMKYADEDNTEVEWIWNSRDGVTPLCVSNRAGDKMLRHIDWHLDRCIRDYQPLPCERVFVNLTIERARQRAECTVEYFWDRDDCAHIRELYGTRENAVEGVIAKSKVGKAPDLIEFRSLAPTDDNLI